MKWLLVALVLIASLAFSAWMLNAMHVIDVESLAIAGLERIPGFQDRLALYRLGGEADQIIDRQARELALLQAELAMARHDLALAQSSIDAEREALEAERAELDQLRRQLDAREASLSSQARNVADFQRLQQMYAEMRPRDVVPILSEFDDSIVARLLGGMANDRAAAILAEFPPERAARVSKAVGGISTK